MNTVILFLILGSNMISIEFPNKEACNQAKIEIEKEAMPVGLCLLKSTGKKI